jgi:hypothetical protein
MHTHFSAQVRTFARRILSLLWWPRQQPGGGLAAATLTGDAHGYVGLFQGTLETTGETGAGGAWRGRSGGSPTRSKPTVSASGFVRLNVDHRKKATGRLMLFVDGQVLTGDLESASERTGRIRAARCRLDTPDSPRRSEEQNPGFVSAAGHLRLHGRAAGVDHDPRSSHGDGDSVTIRFV